MPFESVGWTSVGFRENMSMMLSQEIHRALGIQGFFAPSPIETEQNPGFAHCVFSLRSCHNTLLVCVCGVVNSNSIFSIEDRKERRIRTERRAGKDGTVSSLIPRLGRRIKSNSTVQTSRNLEDVRNVQRPTDSKKGKLHPE